MPGPALHAAVARAHGRVESFYVAPQQRAPSERECYPRDVAETPASGDGVARDEEALAAQERRRVELSNFVRTLGWADPPGAPPSAPAPRSSGVVHCRMGVPRSATPPPRPAPTKSRTSSGGGCRASQPVSRGSDASTPGEVTGPIAGPPSSAATRARRNSVADLRRGAAAEFRRGSAAEARRGRGWVKIQGFTCP